MDDHLKAYIVYLILNGRLDEALEILSKWYGVEKPKIRIGRVKGRSKALAVYLANKKTIVIQDGSLYTNPFVILHEFYHHIRYRGGKHRGTEKNADEYAKGFIDAYRRVSSKYSGEES